MIQIYACWLNRIKPNYYFLIKGFVIGSLKTKNIDGEVQVGFGTIGDYLYLRTNDDDKNLIEIDYAIRSDINQLQWIEFDIIFSEQINHVRTLNYIPVDITNRTVATTVDNGELDDFSLCLEYEVNDCLGYTKVLWKYYYFWIIFL